MKKITLLLSFIACVGFMHAQSLLVDNFEYTVGDLIGQGSWGLTGSASSPSIQVAAGSLSYDGYSLSGIGNEVSLGISGQDLNKGFTAQKSGFVYASSLVNVTSAGTGDYFIHFGELTSTTSFFCRVYVKLVGNNIAFGVTNCSGGTPTQTYTASSYTLNTTYLLVMKVNVVTGESFIILNPTISSTEPTTGWTSNISGTTVPSSANGIGTINLRQGSSSAGVSSTSKVDGIHVSSTWADLFTLTGLSTPSANAFSANVVGNRLLVKNVANGSTVEIFSTLGAKVQSSELVDGNVSLNSLSKGMYIVRVGKNTQKIML